MNIIQQCKYCDKKLGRRKSGIELNNVCPECYYKSCAKKSKRLLRKKSRKLKKIKNKLKLANDELFKLRNTSKNEMKFGTTVTVNNNYCNDSGIGSVINLKQSEIQTFIKKVTHRFLEKINDEKYNEDTTNDSSIIFLEMLKNSSIPLLKIFGGYYLNFKEGLYKDKIISYISKIDEPHILYIYENFGKLGVEYQKSILNGEVLEIYKIKNPTTIQIKTMCFIRKYFMVIVKTVQEYIENNLHSEVDIALFAKKLVSNNILYRIYDSLKEIVIMDNINVKDQVTDQSTDQVKDQVTDQVK